MVTDLITCIHYTTLINIIALGPAALKGPTVETWYQTKQKSLAKGVRPNTGYLVGIQYLQDFSAATMHAFPAVAVDIETG